MWEKVNAIRALMLAIRMPRIVGALAPRTDNAYILRMNAPNVKLAKLPKSGAFHR
jgi:hypothetical protein